ncbi:MAG: alpha/beta hydrolase [Planctomycetota bacterium]
MYVPCRLLFRVGLSLLMLAGFGRASLGQPDTGTGAPPPVTKKSAAGPANPDGAAPNPAPVRGESLAKLRLQFSDPSTAEQVIPSVFTNTPVAKSDMSLTVEEQKQLLREALRHSSLKVRRQAAIELQRREWLEDVVAEALLGLLGDQDHTKAIVVVTGLEHVAMADPPDEYVRALLYTAQIAETDYLLKNASEAQLQRIGARAVPLLLEFVLNENANPEQRRTAAKLLGKLAGTIRPQTRQSGMAMDAPATTGTSGSFQTTPEVVSARIGHESPKATSENVPLVRETPDGYQKLVRVYFGTNRAIVSPQERSNYQIWLCPLLGLGVAIWAVTTFFGKSRQTFRGIFFLLVSGVLFWQGVSAYALSVELSRGLVFGNGRDPDSRQIHHGWCEVSLPAGRKPGKLPMTIPGLENADEHVILKQTRRLERESFYADLRARLAGIKPGSKDCFVFVHGYQVDFRDAACRTAQLHLDLEFPGVPLFFSWPSRAALSGYVVDANEVGNSAGLLKQFLQDVVKESHAERVHIIAHSKGGEIVSRALNELDPNQRLFHQVILAAPDIDADVFNRDIVPKLSKVALRATLYCSKKDLALQMSKAVNGYRRAGDGYGEPLVSPPLDTVDASEIDTSLLGHSYYGDCGGVIRDIRELLLHNTTPEIRGLPTRKNQRGEAYWYLRRDDQSPTSAPAPEVMPKPPDPADGR